MIWRLLLRAKRIAGASALIRRSPRTRWPGCGHYRTGTWSLIRRISIENRRARLWFIWRPVSRFSRRRWPWQTGATSPGTSGPQRLRRARFPTLIMAPSKVSRSSERLCSSRINPWARSLFPSRVGKCRFGTARLLRSTAPHVRRPGCSMSVTWAFTKSRATKRRHFSTV